MLKLREVQMKIDFKQSLTNLDGSPLEVTVTACSMCRRPRETKPATLQDLCSDALVQGYRDARGQPIELSGEESVRRYDLARRIINEGTVEVTPEDLTLIRELVAKRYTPLYAGQAWTMLDA